MLLNKSLKLTYKSIKINQEFCCKPEARVTLRLKQADVGFYSLYFPKGEKKSSCHRTFQAAGTETAAVRVEKQSGPSLKWPAPFSSHLRPDIPTVKISVHTPRVQQGKRLITEPQGHTHTHTQGWPPPTDDISKTREKQDNCYCQPACTHGQQTGAGVCVCVQQDMLNQQACPLLSAVIQRDLCTQSVFISKQSTEETGSGSMRGEMWFRYRTLLH